MTEQTSPHNLISIARLSPRVYIRGTECWRITAFWSRALRNCALICPVGVFDLNQLGALDTAGATLLALLLGEDRVANLRELAPKLPEERRILLKR
jgi:phospholipid/cholesterol/gamma-HCH transport system permease protein